MKKSLIFIALALVLVAAVVCGAIGGRWYGDNRKSNFSGRAELYVYPDMTSEDVLASIPDSIVIRKRSLERVFSSLASEEIKPGHYVIEKGKPSVYVPRMLKAGWQTPVNLVLSGTMRQKGVIARKISNQMMMDSLTVVKALNDNGLLSKYGFSSFGTRKKYYQDNNEDALIMWTKNIFDESYRNAISDIKKELESTL